MERRFFVPITQSGNQTYTPPLDGVTVFAAGDLRFTDGVNTITRTFESAANGGAYPYDLVGKIVSIIDTETTLTDAQMLGFRY